MTPISNQPPGVQKSSARETPSSSRKEGLAATSSNNVSRQDSRVTFGGTSTPGRQSKSYQCQCRSNDPNAVHDCSQYARKEDYPFYASSENDAKEWEGWQQDEGGRGQAAPGPMLLQQQDGLSCPPGGWQQGRTSSSLQFTCCLMVNDSQQTDEQDVNETNRLLDGEEACVDGNDARLGQQDGRICTSSKRPTSCHLSSPAAVAAATVPTPQPKVMHVAPPFEGTTVYKGEFQDVKLSDYRGRYLCLFFYPLDFTFVCPTEIRAMSDLHDQFKEANCAILGCSCDSQFTHLAYIKTSKQNNGLGEITFPLLSDYTKKISADYNVLTKDGTPLRALFIIDPVGIIRNITINDAGVGRNTDEVLRMVQAIKRVDDFDEMCPHGWIPGSITIVPTRHGALSYYKQVFREKSDHNDEKQEETEACSSHVDYEQEKMNML